MHLWDADEWLGAHSWGIRYRGRDYVARPVSVSVVIAAMEELQRSGGNQRAELLTMRKLFRHAFPWRISMLWRGDPVRYIMRLDPLGYRALVADFFGRLGLAPESQSLGTPGSSSQSA